MLDLGLATSVLDDVPNLDSFLSRSSLYQLLSPGGVLLALVDMRDYFLIPFSYVLLVLFGIRFLMH